MQKLHFKIYLIILQYKNLKHNLIYELRFFPKKYYVLIIHDIIVKSSIIGYI
jgi:hypothetical protein